jgi:hypothetical protein
MALPPRSGAKLVVLGNPEAVTPFPAGAGPLPYANTTQDYIDVTSAYLPDPAWLPRQQSFSAYQDWFSEYPAECIVKVSQGLDNTANYIRPASTGTAAVESTFPTDIVTSYDPDFPYFDPVPDPNGITDDFTGSTSTGSISKSLFPRWYDATPYDMANTSSYDYWQTGGFLPLKNNDYVVGPYGGTMNLGCVCSVQLTVENLQSKVLNESTSAYEYYPFTQATFEYKQTAKVKIPIDWEICCWNDGAVITGGVTFSSIDVETVPLGSPFDPDYGFQGMTATTGETITEESSTTWSVTISSSYTAVEIEIPPVADKMSFITDFWIQSVTAPT